MILVWWFECGMIVWLQYDGVIVLFVNVVNVNAYKSKKLQRNVKQKIDWKNHKKYRLSFLQHFPQYRDTGIPWRYLKSREKSLQPSFGLPSCITAYLLKTLKSKSAIFYIIISKKYTILKRSSESSGTSRTYTHLNQNTGEDFREKRSSNFTIQSSGSSGTWAANRVHLDSTKFLFSSKYFSQAKVPEKYGSQEIQS